MKELTSILKRTFPNMTTIGDRGSVDSEGELET